MEKILKNEDHNKGPYLILLKHIQKKTKEKMEKYSGIFEIHSFNFSWKFQKNTQHWENYSRKIRKILPKKFGFRRRNKFFRLCLAKNFSEDHLGSLYAVMRYASGKRFSFSETFPDDDDKGKVHKKREKKTNRN